VVATPTLYLLDKKLQIVKKIVTPQQLEAFMALPEYKKMKTIE